MGRPRNKRFDSIVWMLFALAVIILVMWQLQQRDVYQPPELSMLQTGQRIAVVDSVFFHLPFYFTWRLPNQHWDFQHTSHDSVFNSIESQDSLFSHINWLASARHHLAQAECRLGVLVFDERPDVHNTSIGLLYELLNQNDAETDVITPVTSGAHHVLGGRYFVIRMHAHQNDIYIVSLLPRKNWLYVIQSRVSETDYSLLRPDLELCVSQFRALSMLK